VGPAGIGKTALAAEAVAAVVGQGAKALASSPFPDGVVYLDLYTFAGQAEPAWSLLANTLKGAEFADGKPARARATEACRGRSILAIIESAEELDGRDGRLRITAFLEVFSPENRWLLLTRDITQAAATDAITLTSALTAEEATQLFDRLVGGRVTSALRTQVLDLLEGHPLALTWAANLLARDDEDPARLVSEWARQGLPALSDPVEAEHTLEWLFERSVRGLDDNTQRALTVAGLLARAPFSFSLIEAASGVSTRESLKRLVQRGILRRYPAEPDTWEFTHVLAYRFARRESGTDREILRLVGEQLFERLQASVSAFDTEVGPPALSALQHAAALLRADDRQQLWFPLANFLLSKGCGDFIRLGRLDLVATAITALSAWFDRMPSQMSGEARWQRELLWLRLRGGDLAVTVGNVSEGRRLFRDGLAVAQALVARDPTNTDWQRGLAVCHDRIGDVLVKQSDRAEALTSFRKGLAIRERLAAQDPTNTDWQRGLAVSHDRIGDVLVAQGDRAGALTAFRKGLAIREPLAVRETSWRWQRDLSLSHEMIGNVLLAQGDQAGALTAFQTALAIRESLVARDPTNTERQRDFSFSHDRIGDVLIAQGDQAGALTAFRKGLTIREALTARDPANSQWQRDLSISQEKIGSVLVARGDAAGALTAFRKGLAIREALTARDPANTQWQRDLSYVSAKLASYYERQHDHANGLRFAEQALKINEWLAELDPTNASWQKDVNVSRAQLARLRNEDSR
jgi:predicted negative regulator of RcsB-dependent stress response